MKKCIVFCRVSTLAQELEAQKEKVISFALADGYKTDEIVVVEGKESAIKLKEEERQTLREMKEIIANNPSVEAVYVFAIDRLARRVSVILSVKDYLLERGINLVFINPHKMATMRVNEKGEKVEDELTTMMLMFLSYGAEMEMKIKKERFKTAKDSMRKQGKIVDGKVLLGYKRDSFNNAVIDETVASHIIKAFQSYATGKTSLTQIINNFIGVGIFPSNTKPNRMSKVLKNLNYSGRGNKGYPAIIDAETQDKCITILDAYLLKPKSLSKNIYYAKGFVKWSGKAMKIDRPKNQYLEIGGTSGISVNIAETVAWFEAANIYKIKLTWAKKEKNDSYNREIEENRKQIETFNSLIDGVYDKKSKAFKMLLDGKVPEEIYKEQVDEIDAEQKKWQKEIARLQGEITMLEGRLASLGNEIVPYGQNIVEDVTDDIARRKIVEETIETINISKDENRNYTLTVTPKKEFEYEYNMGTRCTYEYQFHSSRKYKLLKHYEGQEWSTCGKTEDITDKILRRFIQKQFKKPAKS